MNTLFQEKKPYVKIQDVVIQWHQTLILVDNNVDVLTLLLFLIGLFKMHICFGKEIYWICASSSLRVSTIKLLWLCMLIKENMKTIGDKENFQMPSQWKGLPWGK